MILSRAIVNQGKTPWVDSTCADCPGFLCPGFCSHPGFHLGLGASECSPGLAFCFMGPWTVAWICCPQLPHHPCKNGTHSTFFYSTGGHGPSKAPVTHKPQDTKKRKKQHQKEFLSQSSRKCSPQIPKISLNKGSFGDLRATFPALETCGCSIGGLLVPRVEIATGALQSF